MPSAYEGTDIISCLRSKYIIRQRRISYRVSDILLKSATIYDISSLREGSIMSENKLLDLSFEFAVAIVNLVDGVTAPKSSYMTDQLARAGTSVGANIHEAQYAQSKKRFCCKARDCTERNQRNKLLVEIDVRNQKNRYRHISIHGEALWQHSQLVDCFLPHRKGEYQMRKKHKVWYMIAVVA